MSVLRRRPWSVAADCSTPARQPHETHGHRGWTDELTAPATSVSRHSVDGDERRFQMSAAGFHWRHVWWANLNVLCCMDYKAERVKPWARPKTARQEASLTKILKVCIKNNEQTTVHRWRRRQLNVSKRFSSLYFSEMYIFLLGHL